MTTYLIKPIHGVDLRQNPDDGAILMELNGEIHADVINADMNAITGEAPNSNTLYDIYNRLIAAPATEAKQDDMNTVLGATNDADSDGNEKDNLFAFQDADFEIESLKNDLFSQKVRTVDSIEELMDSSYQNRQEKDFLNSILG